MLLMDVAITTLLNVAITTINFGTSSGYTSAPIVSLTGGGGSGLNITPNLLVLFLVVV